MSHLESTELLSVCIREAFVSTEGERPQKESKRDIIHCIPLHIIHFMSEKITDKQILKKLYNISTC